MLGPVMRGMEALQLVVPAEDPPAFQVQVPVGTPGLGGVVGDDQGSRADAARLGQQARSTASPRSGSSDAVGSSASTTTGSFIRARAMPTR